MKRFNKVKNNACVNARDLEIWPKNFDFRSSETELILNKVNLKNKKVLELGCGNTFVSCLLSSEAKEVHACDIPSFNTSTHSIGLIKNKLLSNRLKIKNIFLTGAVNENLPYKDNSFDVIFSQYVLEHVNNKDISLSEIKRVIKPNGIILLVVPNYFERITGFFAYYFHCLRWLLKKIFFVRQVNNVKTTDIKSAFKRHPWLIFPPPHGNYKSSIEEFIAHHPNSWMKLFRKHNIDVISMFTTMIIPFDLLNEILGFNISYKIHKNLLDFFSENINNKFILSISHSITFICKLK